jgi:uncharacterized membrane protein YhhN
MPAIFSIDYFVQLLFVFAAVLLLREFFSFRRLLPAKYLLTPLVTFCVIIFALLAIHSSGMTRYSTFILMGLVLSLVADTLLMIEEINLFKHGLIFFLTAHCFYLGAFTIGYAFSPWHVAAILVLCAGILLFYHKIYRKSGSHHVSVLVYMFVLAAMLFFAVSHVGESGSTRPVLLPAGAVLFVISDVVLAINTFVKKIPHSTVLTWSLYAPAQLFFALSCFY